MISYDEAIALYGGIDAVNARIESIAKPIADKQNMTVDEFLNRMCCRDVYGNETTYRELYTYEFLDGYIEGLENQKR